LLPAHGLCHTLRAAMKAPSARRPALARPLPAIRIAGRHARLVGNVAQFQQGAFQFSRREIELKVDYRILQFIQRPLHRQV
jgi:hypothetical protein